MVNWDGIDVEEEYWLMQHVLRDKGTVPMTPVKMPGCCTIKVMKEANHMIISKGRLC